MNIVVRLLLLMLPLAVASLVYAQPYPVKSIRVIVPYPAGGGTDIVARIVTARLSERLGQQAVIDNRGGAAGTIGADMAAKAPADGYTLLLTTNAPLTINPHLHRSLSYDPVRDFAPITLVASSPYVLVVHPRLPVASVRELIALARKRPGELNYASSGNGAATHLSGVLFANMARINIVHVPYKGSAPAVTDLIAGQVQMRFSSIPPALPHVRSGRLRALAVTSARRFSVLPDMPTVAESGLPGYEVDSWYGLLAPAGTPEAIVARLNTEIVGGLQLPEVKARLEADGSQAVGTSAQRFASIVSGDLKRWGPVVRDSGARIE